MTAVKSAETFFRSMTFYYAARKAQGVDMKTKPLCRLKFFSVCLLAQLAPLSHAAPQQTYSLDCNLDGMVGKMTMLVEYVSSSGITWGPGVNPSITGVIGTGEYTIYTQGELRSATAHYVFQGENQFADFTEVNSYERFRVQFHLQPNGLVLVANPFGDQPTQYACTTTSIR